MFDFWIEKYIEKLGVKRKDCEINSQYYVGDENIGFIMFNITDDIIFVDSMCGIMDKLIPLFISVIKEKNIKYIFAHNFSNKPEVNIRLYNRVFKKYGLKSKFDWFTRDNKIWIWMEVDFNG